MMTITTSLIPREEGNDGRSSSKNIYNVYASSDAAMQSAQEGDQASHDSSNGRDAPRSNL
jgi:hypothetical protein